jgi:hypothetical protein
MASIKVLKDITATTIVESGYQIYIDTSLEFNGRKYGTFTQKYDPNDEDLFLKKVPKAKDLKLKRTLGSEPRFLHSISKTSVEVKSLKALLNFEFTAETEDLRTIIIDNENVKVIEYSERSAAIFPKPGKLEVVSKMLEEYEAVNAVKNMFLTGPGLVKTKGYVLASRSKQYDEILRKLKEVSGSSEILEGNSQELISKPGDLNDKIKIWGSLGYVQDKLEELNEQESSYTIIKSENLPEDRKMVIVELAKLY